MNVRQRIEAFRMGRMLRRSGFRHDLRSDNDFQTVWNHSDGRGVVLSRIDDGTVEAELYSFGRPAGIRLVYGTAALERSLERSRVRPPAVLA